MVSRDKIRGRRSFASFVMKENKQAHFKESRNPGSLAGYPASVGGEDGTISGKGEFRVGGDGGFDAVD